MANNIVDISVLAPMDFYEENYVNPAPYNTHYDEDWAYPDTIPEYYEHPMYFQPWQKNDIIYFPLLSNYGPHNLELLDCNGNQIDTFVLAYVPSSIEDTGQKFYLASVALNSYPSGYYYFRLSSGSPVLKVMVTAGIHIDDLHPYSFQIRYKHNENDFDVPFETGVEFQFRTFGGFPPEQYKPGSDRTIYIDQERNGVILSGKTYDIDKLIIGDAGGVPKAIIKKVNKILECSSTIFDGKQYVVNEGANFEAVTESEYPMAGWGIDLRPAFNRGRKRFEADGNSNSPTTVVYNLDNSDQDLFGSMTGPASSNIIQIESLND
jgi:hypothetical protein